MTTDHKCLIVIGYHSFNYPPEHVYRSGLVNRFAVVFNTKQPEIEYSYFDAVFFDAILQAICHAIKHDHAIVESNGQKQMSLHELSRRLLDSDPDEREPPKRVLLSNRGQLEAVAETEEWVLTGGPAPYHDSYTLSFYTTRDRSKEFLEICDRTAHALGAVITGVIEMQTSKEPFNPLWRQLLNWVGLRRSIAL